MTKQVTAVGSVRVQVSNFGGQTTEILQESTEVTRQLTERHGTMEFFRNCGIQEMKIKSQMSERESQSIGECVTGTAVNSSNPTTCKTEDCISSELSSYPQSADSLQQPPTDSSSSWSTVAAPSPERLESLSKLACEPSSRLKAPRHPQPLSKPVPQASEGFSTSPPQQSVAVPMSIDQISERLDLKYLQEKFQEIMQFCLGDCVVYQDRTSEEVGLEQRDRTINVNIPISVQAITNKYYRKTYHNKSQVSCQKVNIKKADIVQTGGTMDVHQHLPEGEDHEKDEDEYLYKKDGDDNGDVSSDSEVIDENAKETYMEDDVMEHYT